MTLQYIQQNMPIHKYIEILLFLYLISMYIKPFLCVLIFAAYMCGFLLSFIYGGSKWSNIFYQYDGNWVKKIPSLCTLVRKKISYNTEMHKELL